MNVDSSIIDRSQKSATQMAITWWVDNQNERQPYSEVLFGILRNQVHIQATALMNLENMMPSERS